MPKIIRYEKDSDYTEVNNYMLTDKNISYSAKGLLAYMLHNNAQWRYYICKLKEVSTDGETKISSILKELEEHKYLVRRKFREKGKFKYKFMIFDMPFDYFDKKRKELEKDWADEADTITVVATKTIKFDNDFILNKELSFKAKGLMLFLLSLKKDQEISRKLLENNSTDRESSLRTGIKELSKFEYIIKSTKQKNNKEKKGFGNFEYVINEKPEKQKELPDDIKTELQKQQKLFEYKKIKPSKQLLEYIKEKKISTEALASAIFKIPVNVEFKSAYLMKILKKNSKKANFTWREVHNEISNFKASENVVEFKNLSKESKKYLNEKFEANEFNVEWYIVNFETLDEESSHYNKGIPLYES